MIIGKDWDLYLEADTLLFVDKILGEKFKMPLADFEEYLEDIVEFAADKA